MKFLSIFVFALFATVSAKATIALNIDEEQNVTVMSNNFGINASSKIYLLATNKIPDKLMGPDTVVVFSGVAKDTPVQVKLKSQKIYLVVILDVNGDGYYNAGDEYVAATLPATPAIYQQEQTVYATGYNLYSNGDLGAYIQGRTPGKSYCFFVSQSPFSDPITRTPQLVCTQTK